MASKSKSKVKSYARRTKKGISRVTGHNRDNKNKRNRNIAIGLGIGTSVLALGLGAKHLAKKKGLKTKPQAQSVSFSPNNPKPTVTVETPSAPVAEVRQTTQAVVDKAKEIKADSFKPEMDGPIVRIANRRGSLLDDSAISLARAKETKKRNNTKKVKERKELLKTHTAGKIDTGGGPSSYMNAIQLSWYGDEKIRKQAAKLLAKTARDLRAKGMYS